MADKWDVNCLTTFKSDVPRIKYEETVCLLIKIIITHNCWRFEFRTMTSGRICWIETNLNTYIYGKITPKLTSYFNEKKI